MDENRCGKCKYFIQYYGLIDGRLFEINDGHCIFGRRRTKQRRPGNKACENFIEGENEAEKFAKKEYLTKKLLKRVLEMELLPDVEYLSEFVKEKRE